MKIKFYKYQATGNDFIIIDNRNQDINLTEENIIGSLISYVLNGLGEIWK